MSDSLQDQPPEETSLSEEPSSEAERPSVALPVGTSLREEYRVEEVLGTGSFGITYRARDQNLSTSVAIKEYCPRRLAGRTEGSLTVRPYSSESTESFEQGLQRFMEEGRTLARFDHPNVVSVRSFFEENGTGYLVMDYYEGESLSEYLDRQGGTLPEEEAVSLMLDVLSGLQAVHEEGVLHRDIGPKNIYRKSDGEVLLIDFGAAREAIGQESRDLTTVLTPGYAPIEQYMAGRQGPQTDIYACAATLHRCLVGEVPLEARERAQGAELKSPRQAGAEVSLETDVAVQKGLAIRPEGRPGSAREFADLLEQSSAEEVRTQVAPEMGGPAPPQGEGASREAGVSDSETRASSAPKPSFYSSEASDSPEASEGKQTFPAATEAGEEAEKGKSGAGARGFLILIGTAVTAVVAALLLSETGMTKVLGFFGTWAALAIGIVVLFREGEKAMAPGARAAVSDWLMKESFAKRPSGWPETFVDLFDAVFTEDHFSWRCFQRSALASVISLTAITSVLWLAGVYSQETFLMTEFPAERRPSLIRQVVSAVLLTTLFNIFVDYISLYETRLVIEKIESSNTYSSSIYLLLDITLTLSLVYMGFFVVNATPNVYAHLDKIRDILSRGDILEITYTILNFMYLPIKAFSSVYPFGDGLSSSMVYTTFITSVWVWGYVLSGHVIRLLYPVAGGIEFVKTSLDVQRRPVHSMGVLLAVLTSVGFALSAPFVL